MARVEIKGGQLTLHKVFSDYLFTIPLYQRPYSWGEEQVTALLEDLFDSLGGDSVPVDDLPPYFLGSIVVVKPDHQPDAEVIDGQQRLTTLTMLLSALRHRLASDAEYAESLTTYLYEAGSQVRKTKPRYRLTLQERVADFFRDSVQQKNQLPNLLAKDAGQLTDSKRLIRNNVELMLARLGKESDGRCMRLAQFLIEQCLLVVVSTPDFDSAYRIFTVLNDRGKDLLPSDILKAELIGRVPPDERDEYGAKWEAMEDQLGRDGFAALIPHVRMIYLKTKPKGTVLSEFRDALKTKMADPRTLIDTVLVPYAEAFGTVRRADFHSTAGPEEVNRLLRWLGRIDNADWQPPAIRYLAGHAHDAPALARFLADLERLAAGLMVLRAAVNQRIERYGRVLKALEDGADLYQPDSPLQLTADECGQVRAALDGDIYHLSPRVYVLRRLDDALAAGGVTHDPGLITVEHVLPQSPAAGSQWEGWFPDPAERQAWTHRLGNLALLTRPKNAGAGNLEFAKKKATYFAGKGGVTTFALTTQVLTEAEWTPAVLERRQLQLTARLAEVWRLG